ncbi:hypothetical protein K9L16_01865 [Candidatus Pacearchaeota archaeon]|nr:hypothetical protein [Candidatus Pacearchaeota archaeon]
MPGFVPNKHEKETDDHFRYYGLWALVTTDNQTTYVGKVNEITTKSMFLLPIQIIDYNKEGPFFRIKETGESQLIDRIKITGIRGTSRESTQNFCNYMNKKQKENLNNLK